MIRNLILFVTLFLIALSPVFAQNPEKVAASAQVAPTKKVAAPQPEDKLPWWPTDAKPAPVKDEQRGGFWWWPDEPGSVKELWGNRGYAYVHKIIYDWQGTGSVKNVQVKISDVGFVETEDKPSLLVKRIIRSQKLQFKEKMVEIKPEHAAILKKAADSLKRDKAVDILLTAYNDTSDIGSARTQAIEKFLMDQGVLKERIKILASDKFLEAGLFSKRPPEPGAVVLVIAELKEVMIPGPK